MRRASSSVALPPHALPHPVRPDPASAPQRNPHRLYGVVNAWDGNVTRSPVLPATILLVACSMVVLTASPVFAKGPSQAVLEGPGLTSPVSLRSPGQRTIGPALATMFQESGLFDGLYGTGSGSKVTRPPCSQLGPRFTVTYTLGGPGRDSTIVQYIYPYATPGPVTHIHPDQPLLDRSKDGWWLARRRGRVVGDAHRARTARDAAHH